MTHPIAAAPGDHGQTGASYAGLFVRAERVSVIDQLSQRRFSGWVGPQQQAWVLAVCRSPTGPVAGNGRTLTTLAAEVAGALATVVLASRVHQDEVLHLAGWHAAKDLGSYVSDPSVEAAGLPDGDLSDPDGADPYGAQEAFPEPQGAWHAPAFASACGHPEAAEGLGELLGQTLDHDSVYESERLAAALTLLGLPTWLVSAASLPGDLPAGPDRRDLLTLGAGRTGLGGRFGGLAARLTRRRFGG